MPRGSLRYYLLRRFSCDTKGSNCAHNNAIDKSVNLGQWSKREYHDFWGPTRTLNFEAFFVIRSHSPAGHRTFKACCNPPAVWKRGLDWSNRRRLCGPQASTSVLGEPDVPEPSPKAPQAPVARPSSNTHIREVTLRVDEYPWPVASHRVLTGVQNHIGAASAMIWVLCLPSTELLSLDPPHPAPIYGYRSRFFSIKNARRSRVYISARCL
ncbi:hypothetical protein BDY19DRAFT_569756 [Irpex rosettiformis]|uniref:Uncharacterized protein n=1 Tax=Irpex rosettiformis TaxID=378272 RepID=A0ACB8UCE8_9APHY|nr:hypothetical protein BDY19DRAFT_569756 [Irpex rosettiformis]